MDKQLGRKEALAWMNLWSSGNVPRPIAALWLRSNVTGLSNAFGGMRPITLQESCTKILDSAQFPIRWELGRSATAQQALVCLRAVEWVGTGARRQALVARQCSGSTDIANAFGTLLCQKVVETLDAAIFVVSLANDRSGSVDERDPWGPHQDVTRTGSHRDRLLFWPLGSLLQRRDTPHLACADDRTLWRGQANSTEL